MKKVFTVFAIMIGLSAGAKEGHYKISDSGYAAVNGTKLYYELAGKGPMLILIHGSFGDRRFWNFQFNELSKKYRVLRYDVRGFGRSLLPKRGEAYKDADDLNALMDFLQIKKAHFCGLSMGSIIAIDFAFAYPDKCLSLISIGSRVADDGTFENKTPSADSVRKIISITTEILKNKGTKEATDYLWTGDHSMGKTVVSAATKEVLLKMGYEYSWWRYLNENKREFAFPDGIKNLRRIKIPVLVVTAEYDLQLCKEIAAIIAKEVPNAKLVSIKNAGHIMNMDKSGEFNKMILEFIDKTK